MSRDDEPNLLRTTRRHHVYRPGELQDRLDSCFGPDHDHTSRGVVELVRAASRSSRESAETYVARLDMVIEQLQSERSNAREEAAFKL